MMAETVVYLREYLFVKEPDDTGEPGRVQFPQTSHSWRLALAPGPRVRLGADQGRNPYPNARQSANWTCVDILAYHPALKGGELIRLPEFTLAKRAM